MQLKARICDFACTNTQLWPKSSARVKILVEK